MPDSKWPPRALRAGFRWNESTNWRPPAEGEGAYLRLRHHNPDVVEIFTAWMQGHVSEDALRHALTDPGERSRCDAL